jgi:hypothetical protein
MVTVKIPENMIFVCRIDKYAEDDIMDAFPVKKGNEKTLKRALDWAKRWNTCKSKQFEFPNDNFENLTITGLEERGEGGRAYKVVLELDNNKFRFDLRENILMDIIEHQGIGKGGLLKGPFKFVLVGSQMKLMYVDGDEYKEATERDERTGKRIQDSELVIGGVYQSLNGSTSIYFGKGYKLQYEQDNRNIKNYSDICKIKNIKKSSKKMIWCKPWCSSELNFDEFKKHFLEDFKEKNLTDTKFVMSSSQSNIKCLGKIENVSLSSIREQQFKRILNFNKKITTNGDKFNDYYEGASVYYGHIFRDLASFLYFEENEQIKIPVKVFEKAEELFKNCIDLSELKEWSN